jgi:hypothetical protein
VAVIGSRPATPLLLGVPWGLERGDCHSAGVAVLAKGRIGRGHEPAKLTNPRSTLRCDPLSPAPLQATADRCRLRFEPTLWPYRHQDDHKET